MVCSLLSNTAARPTRYGALTAIALCEASARTNFHRPPVAASVSESLVHLELEAVPIRAEARARRTRLASERRLVVRLSDSLDEFAAQHDAAAARVLARVRNEVDDALHESRRVRLDRLRTLRVT